MYNTHPFYGPYNCWYKCIWFLVHNTRLDLSHDFTVSKKWVLYLTHDLLLYSAPPSIYLSPLITNGSVKTTMVVLCCYVHCLTFLLTTTHIIIHSMFLLSDSCVFLSFHWGYCRGDLYKLHTILLWRGSLKLSHAWISHIKTMQM